MSIPKLSLEYPQPAINMVDADLDSPNTMGETTRAYSRSAQEQNYPRISASASQFVATNTSKRRGRWSLLYGILVRGVEHLS